MPFFQRHPHDQHRDEHASPRMEILLDREFCFLRGTGADVEPGRLAGHVALYLTEPTTIRAITLQFRGKAYLPGPPADSMASGSSVSTPPSTYVLCRHAWSFLAGAKTHGHTLKAGRHLFPFQLQLGGALPASAASSALSGGEAGVAYKLRAVAVRGGAFSSNLQAAAPVYVVRSLGRAALEYQQTRDIEHVWLGKLMFSVAVPHSAWAAGDSLVALLKVTPLVKGVGVLTVTTSLRETTKMFGRPGNVTRTVASVTHEILGGRAVEIKEPVDPKGKQPRVSPSDAAGPSTENVPPDPTQSEDDVVTTLHLPLPSSLTPTSTLDPLRVSYVVHWSVIVTNVDGHLSELFCSLPILLLDSQLLCESRMHTRAARRLLVGGPEVQQGAEDTNELPDYTNHIRDRIANMYLSEGNMMRVTNPWVQSGIDPILGKGHHHHPPIAPPKPLEVITDCGGAAYVPDPEHPVFLDWGNSELFISHGSTKYSYPDTPPVLDSEPVSRASTPDHLHQHPPTPPMSPADGMPTYTHSSPASRELPGLFAARMEATSALTHPHWLGARPDAKETRRASVEVQRRARSVGRAESDGPTGSVLLHRAFTEVPDYEVASRGFLGGVPPLSSMQGLPSYDEASRSGTPRSGTPSREL
ncbi:hypothetical protein C8J57DRAFT_1500638 [Mycena rebaudengoi]|nr:hypothetical protein C8J57DRAFT_1500638 [Mycena rebaudengoi]